MKYSRYFESPLPLPILSETETTVVLQYYQTLLQAAKDYIAMQGEAVW